MRERQKGESIGASLAQYLNSASYGIPLRPSFLHVPAFDAWRNMTASLEPDKDGMEKGDLAFEDAGLGFGNIFSAAQDPELAGLQPVKEVAQAFQLVFGAGFSHGPSYESAVPQARAKVLSS